MSKTPRVYIVIDNGMIWEAYSDIPQELIIHNVDKKWIRRLPTVVYPNGIDPNEDLLITMEESKVEFPGLKAERKKHRIITKPKIFLKLLNKNHHKVR